MSLTSATRRAALSVSRSASTPGSRAQRMASRTSEVEIRTCRMRSSRTKRWMLASMSGGLLSLGAARARGACRGPRRRSGCPGRGSPGASSGARPRQCGPSPGARGPERRTRRRGGPPRPSPRGPPGRRGRRPRRRRRAAAWSAPGRSSARCPRGRARGHGRDRARPGSRRWGRRASAAHRGPCVTSLSYLTTTLTVSERTCEFSSSMPSTASVRAQSMVSEMLGALRSSSSRRPRTTSTSSRATASGSPVFLERTISSSRSAVG